MGNHPESGEMLRAEFAAAVVALIEENDFVSGTEFRHQQPDDGGHAARVDDGVLGAIEGCEFAFYDFFIRIPVATILLAVLFLVDVIEDAFGGLKSVSARATDRIGDRIAGFLTGFSSVYAFGAQAQLSILVRSILGVRSASGRRIRGRVSGERHESGSQSRLLVKRGTGGKGITEWSPRSATRLDAGCA